MAYAIIRISKLKVESVAGSGKHVGRGRSVSNANSEIINITIIENNDGKQPLADIVKNKIQEKTQLRKIRTDAVHCVEILLTASPEYFRPDEPERYGYYEPEKLSPWIEANVKWLKEKYQDKLVRAELHLDEGTPHIHAFLVPLDDRGQLNCKSIFGGRDKMKKFQDSYHSAVNHLGLERGIRGSQANHVDIKKYYTLVNEGIKSHSDLSIDRIQQLQSQATIHRMTVVKNRELEKTLKFISKENEELIKENNDLQKIVKTKAGINQGLTDKIPTIKLSKIAYELGLNPNMNNERKWSKDEKEIELIENGFYDWEKMKPRVTAIDLVMSVKDINFEDAVSWLRNSFGESVAVQLSIEHTEKILLSQPRKEFIPSIEASENWLEVRDNLVNRWQLPVKLIDKIHLQGQIYTDQDKQLVILKRSLSGEVNGAIVEDDQGRSNGWFYVENQGDGEDDLKIVLLDSAIEVMAYETLHPTTERRICLALNEGGYVPDELKEVGEIILGTKSKVSNLTSDVKKHLPIQNSWVEELQVYLKEVQKELEKVKPLEKNITVKPKKLITEEKEERSQGFGMGM